VDFGAGPLTSAGGYDIFVAKFDPSGNCTWSVAFGDSANQGGSGIATDSENDVLITGFFAGTTNFGGGGLTATAGGDDIFVAKLDPTGAYLWAKAFGSAVYATGAGIAVDGSGDILTNGTFEGTIDLGAGALTSPSGEISVYLAKFKSSGRSVWSKGFFVDPDAGANSAETFQLALDSAGDSIFTGYFGGTIDFGAGPLVSAGGADLFCAKFDPSGSLLWANRFGGLEDQMGTGTALDTAGNIFVTGTFGGTLNFGLGVMSANGNGDVFLAKLDPLGNALWNQHYGDPTSDNNGVIEFVAVDSSGNPTIAGGFFGNANFGGGILMGSPSGLGVPYVAKLTNAGGYGWAYLGTNLGVVGGLGTDAPDDVVLAGAITSPPAAFAGATLPDAGPFLIKLSP
jgi:hypothetical protein